MSAHPAMDRRLLLSMLSIGAAQALIGCASGHAATSATAALPTGDPPGHSGGARSLSDNPASPAGVHSPLPLTSPDAPVTPVPTPSSRGLPPIPPARPGPPTTVFQAPGPTRRIALTIDDGYDTRTVAGYVEFAQRSRIPLTFSPNGAYSAVWSPHADVLRPLVESEQIQIVNHTWSHRSLQSPRTDADIRADVERNEQWIQTTFGITSRPWFRPPYGAHNAHVDGLVGELGYTRILLWNGSFGDSTLITPEQLMSLASRYLQPGTVMLGHANHATILGLFSQVEKLIAERRLEPVTLDTMFGTSRSVG
ncbi:polysaccharide deacetylase family protein [Frankia umida]|nr:polysaccharide deacetylase family protein [Frankia umida]